MTEYRKVKITKHVPAFLACDGLLYGTMWNGDITFLPSDLAQTMFSDGRVEVMHQVGESTQVGSDYIKDQAERYGMTPELYKLKLQVRRKGARGDLSYRCPYCEGTQLTTVWERWGYTAWLNQTCGGCNENWLIRNIGQKIPDTLKLMNGPTTQIDRRLST